MLFFFWVWINMKLLVIRTYQTLDKHATETFSGGTGTIQTMHDNYCRQRGKNSVLERPLVTRQTTMNIAPDCFRLAWRKNISVQQALLDWKWMRGLRHISIALHHFVDLRGRLQQIRLSDSKDTITWHLAANGSYSAASTYVVQLEKWRALGAPRSPSRTYISVLIKFCRGLSQIWFGLLNVCVWGVERWNMSIDRLCVYSKKACMW